METKSYRYSESWRPSFEIKMNTLSSLLLSWRFGKRTVMLMIHYGCALLMFRLFTWAGYTDRYHILCDDNCLEQMPKVKKSEAVKRITSGPSCFRAKICLPLAASQICSMPEAATAAMSSPWGSKSNPLLCGTALSLRRTWACVSRENHINVDHPVLCAYKNWWLIDIWKPSQLSVPPASW